MDAPTREAATPTGAQDRSEEQEGVGSPPPFPPLRAVIWARFGVAALTLWAWLTFGLMGLHETHGEPGEVLAFLLLFPVLSAIPLITFGLPSFFIALCLLQRSHAAIRVALWHDALILSGSIMGLIPTWYQHFEAWDPPTLMMAGGRGAAVGLAFAAEAAYILRRAFKWRPAWSVFALLAAGLISTVMIVPHVLWARMVRDVQPLLTYVNAYWLDIPPGAGVALGQRPKLPDVHTDQIMIRGQRITWALSADHGPDGRWTFPKGQFPADPTFSGSPSASGEERHVRSLDEAKDLLLQAGVVDSGLQPQRVATDGSTYYEFWFWSPLGQGRYRVCYDNRLRPIEFYLDYPLEAP
jgi:hypothetical protein